MDMSDKCPKCGGEQDLTEKDTSSGTDHREYTCRSCGHVEAVSYGKALWQILSEDREREEAWQALRGKLPPSLTAEGSTGFVGRLNRGDADAVLAVGRIVEKSTDSGDVGYGVTLLELAESAEALQELRRLAELFALAVLKALRDPAALRERSHLLFRFSFQVRDEALERVLREALSAVGPNLADTLMAATEEKEPSFDYPELRRACLCVLAKLAIEQGGAFREAADRWR